MTKKLDSVVARRRICMPVGCAGQVRERPAARCAPSLTTVCLDRWTQVPDFASLWGDLVDRADHCSVFQTFQWHQCWWEAYGKADELLLVLAYAGSRLVGIAPMMIRRSGVVPGRAGVHFIGSVNDASDYCDFIVDRRFPDALDALLAAIHANLGVLGRLDLSHLPDRSAHGSRVFDYFRSRGVKIDMAMREASPTRILGDADADRKVVNKKSLKRHTRYFQKRGDLRFHHCTSVPEILSWLDTFFDQHRARRALTDAPSRFHDPGARLFYRKLVHALVPPGWLRFHIVTFDGAPVAFHFGFEFRGSFIWYKPSFEPALASRSPGEVLIKFLLEDAIARQLEEFDFTIGAEAFKFRFANETRYVSRIVAYRSTLDYWLCRARRGLSTLGRCVRSIAG